MNWYAIKITVINATRSYLSTEDIVKLEHWINESMKSTKNIIHFVSDHDGVAQYIIEDISNIQSYLYTITQYLDLIRTKKLRSWINKASYINTTTQFPPTHFMIPRNQGPRDNQISIPQHSMILW